ncbi:hypothetical protein QBC37DRAFT_403220 [Rhypophila decipiens]|uniref:Uncharacterized protein n=1 Tax=Rhypophila decipiens TaxID=261697 RepID=A0AAN6Y131_9PEZI|nr:hypothetical protein QBC37DRAFT_403220 [Rhypophila decipiens]
MSGFHHVEACTALHKAGTNVQLRQSLDSHVVDRPIMRIPLKWASARMGRSDQAGHSGVTVTRGALELGTNWGCHRGNRYLCSGLHNNSRIALVESISTPTVGCLKRQNFGASTGTGSVAGAVLGRVCFTFSAAGMVECFFHSFEKKKCFGLNEPQWILMGLCATRKIKPASVHSPHGIQSYVIVYNGKPQAVDYRMAGSRAACRPLSHAGTLPQPLIESVAIGCAGAWLAACAAGCAPAIQTAEYGRLHLVQSSAPNPLQTFSKRDVSSLTPPRQV